MSDEIVREFLVEGNENLDTLDRELIQLEKDPHNRATLASVFRTIHTIKGTCGFLGFTKLEAVAHVGENLLSKVREGELVLNSVITTALLRMVDAVRRMLQSIEAIGNEGERDDDELIKMLARVTQGESLEDASVAPVPAAALTAPAVINVSQPPNPPPAILPAARSKKAKTASPASNAKIEKQQALAPHLSAELPVETLVAAPIEATRVPVTAAEQNTAANAATQSLKSGTKTKIVPAEHEKAPGTEENDAPQAQAARRAGVNAESIRVDVALLDKLMNLVGELVLARNQVLQFSSTADDPAIVAPSHRLNLITTELQEGVMKTRMQPIGNIWSKFPRTVRDVATSCGKQVRIEMFGQEAELDKTIIEAIKDPLTHLVRNSVDHGIERPEARVAAGKRAEGCLTLRAYHQGGQVNIEISDDGAGLDQEKIRRKAVERGLLTADKAAQLSEREILNLIFLPGFSTAEKITNVSGRGVGMDVVKTNIEKIGGTVEVQSAVGVGTTVKTKIPLTLAIIPGLVVRSSGERFVIPQVSLIELVRIDGGPTRRGIEMVQGVPVYRLRGRLLPLLYLDRELKISKPPVNSAFVEEDVSNMVVLQADGRQFGLIVDEIKDAKEIVVKPLDGRLKGLKVFAGATIMGDGLVALILDVPGLAQRAGIISESSERTAAAVSAGVPDERGEKQTFLVLVGPDDARMAIPLDALARLEKFAASRVERSGAECVIQNRGKILPLVYLNAALEERRQRARHTRAAPADGDADADVIQVVVCNHDARTVGLVVEGIVDIVEDRAEVRSAATRRGVLYSAVIQERVTKLLDLDVILGGAAALIGAPPPAHEEDLARVRG
jgi:two-component system chemotaxis sensor kinase CheA